MESIQLTCPPQNGEKSLYLQQVHCCNRRLMTFANGDLLMGTKLGLGGVVGHFVILHLGIWVFR